MIPVYKIIFNVINGKITLTTEGYLKPELSHIIEKIMIVTIEKIYNSSVTMANNPSLSNFIEIYFYKDVQGNVLARGIAREKIVAAHDLNSVLTLLLELIARLNRERNKIKEDDPFL